MSTMNCKKWLYGAGVLATCFMLTGCHIRHEWQEATCTEPRTCLTGGETEGEPLGHTLTEANYQQAAVCTVCGETVGEPLQADYEKYGLECNAELDTSYPYVTTCNKAPEYTTAGHVTFSDYEVFTSDDTHPALDGYEWRAVTLTFTFDDENAQKYGVGLGMLPGDYYDEILAVDSWDASTDTYTVNFNGVDCSECTFQSDILQNSWIDNVWTYQSREFYRVPENYDGTVRIVINRELYDQYVSGGGELRIKDLADDETIFFRLK